MMQGARLGMPLTNKLSPHNPAWFQHYEDEAEALKFLVGDKFCDIHHVGSTAVAGLVAKPEIDILIVVSEETDYSILFSNLGYQRGGDLSPGHQFYKKDFQGVRTHKVHVCTLGHCSIRNFLLFRDYLRTHPVTRDEYGRLKLKLEAQNTGGIQEYLHAKAGFIQDVLAKANK